jgi:hypothetical protein
MNQLLFLPLITPLLLVLYLFPGFFLARLFQGRVRNHPLFWVLLSLLFNGTLYSFLAAVGAVTLLNWLLAELLVLLPVYGISQRVAPLVWAPANEGLGRRSAGVLFLLILVAVFFLLTAFTKFGIFIKRTPIVADDYSQIPKVVSIAVAKGGPEHFYYPLSNLSYYYYGQVSAGLLTRFSGNYVKANRAFAINFVVQLAASLYLVWLASLYLFESVGGRLFFLLPLTFFGGFEFPVSFLMGERDLFGKHLEYWPGFPLIRSMPQISSFATMSIWAPHHLFSALLLLFLFLLLFKVSGHRFLKLFFLALMAAGAMGFSFFSGLVLPATYLVFALFSSWRGNLRSALVEVGLALLGTALLVAPFLLIIGIGGRGTEFSFSLARLHLITGVASVKVLADFLVGLPLYFFLELGILFLGLLWAIRVLVMERFPGKETVFWLIPLLPLVFILFFKFPEATDFVMRSRSIAPSLLALAVFTGWAGERLPRKGKIILLFLFLVTTLPPLSEFWQNFQTTPRAYTFFSDLDKELPLNALVFTEQRAAPYFWPVPIFIHRPTVKPNPFWDQVDLQYTGLPFPPPDGLKDDDFGAVREFIDQHPFLRQDYQVYYLSLQKLNLPVVYQDLDYRLYRL